MSEQNSQAKKKSPIIGVVAVILLLAAGAVAYFTQSNKSTDHIVDDSNQSNTMTKASDGADAATVEAASGDATAQTTKIGENPDVAGIDVKPGNPVVAKVDGKDISRVDVYRFIQTMPANVQQMPAIQVYPIAMDQVINTRIVQTQADKAKIEESEEYKREMEVAGQQIARNLYLQKQVDAKITDKMVKSSYDDYAKQIPTVEERRARHILVETEAKAKAVVAQLKAGGDFEAVAKELSVGPTAPKGGDLGYFAKTEMVPEFANAAFGMKKNSILETPVKTQFGWHVIQVVDIRERPKPTLEQMTPALRAELSRTTLDGLLVEWRKDAKIEQFDINGQPLKEGADVIGIVPQQATVPAANDNAPAKKAPAAKTEG